MERILHTVILPDGLPLDICQEIREERVSDTETILVEGLKRIRVAGGTITLPEAHALLKATGHVDVIQTFHIPSW